MRAVVEMVRRFHISFPHLSRPLAWLLAVGCVALTSCGSAKPRRPVVPVSGQLFVQGKSASGAMVILRPTADSAAPDEVRAVLPHATVRHDGSFQIGTYDVSDGAPVGDYVVLVQWDENAAQGDAEVTESKFVDRLGGRYSDPARSTLRVTVSAPKTMLPKFELD